MGTHVRPSIYETGLEGIMFLSASVVCSWQDPDQPWQNIGAWSGSKLLDTQMIFLKIFLQVNFEKKSADIQKRKIPNF